jgi:aspartyl-tRNA(Asn)/glutamyl-tRNA(Gln) amidotransferase subunit A
VSLASLAAALRTGELSPVEAVQSFLVRIEELEPQVNAYISVRGEEALAEARALERAPSRGPLWGVPVAVKDVIDVAGSVTSAGSKILAHHVASEDATVVARLRASGAVILGKANTHEFAYGATTTSPHFGPARNPWSLDRICGGSSGGSGAAVAAGLAAGTLGTDTAGSIRIPACLCGATGLRPTTGRVSNRGVVPVSWTFDTVGPIARTAEDCALLLGAIAGHDAADPTTAEVGVPGYAAGLGGGVAGLRIGVVRTLLEGDVHPGVAAAVEDALSCLSSLGARVEPADLPLFEQAGTIQQAMQFPEATTAHLHWLRTRLADYGADVRARLLVGLFLAPTVYVTGQRARRLFFESWRPVLERFDLLAAPTMPVPAPRIGEETIRVAGTEIPYRLALIRFNSCWSLPGLPAASVPCGFVEGLPVGLALVGRRFAEGTVLRVAHAFQQATDWHERRPALAASPTAAPPGEF